MKPSRFAAGLTVVLVCLSCSAQPGGQGDDVVEHVAQGELFRPVPPEDPWRPVGSSNEGFYSAEYANMVVVAEDDSGQRMVMVAGRHSKHQPYFQKGEPWDDVLLAFGETALTVSGSELAGFEVAFDDVAGWLHLYLDLEMIDPMRTEVHVSADLSLDATFHPAEFFGLDLGESGDKALGMTHRPAFLSLGSSPSVIAVGSGPATKLTSCTGELELGHINYATDPGMAYTYDYVCLVCPQKGYVYLHFAGHALSPEGPFGELFEELLAKSMAQEITMQGGTVLQGRPDGLPDDLFSTAGIVLVSRVQDVGLADMERQIVQLQAADSTPVWGLRELFEAK